MPIFMAELRKCIMAHNLLKGKRGIIFGALDERSIAWKVAQVAKAEGAVFTLTNALSLCEWVKSTNLRQNVVQK